MGDGDGRQGRKRMIRGQHMQVAHNIRIHLPGCSGLRPLSPAGDAGRWASVVPVRHQGKRIVKQVYLLAYPTGKIYVGKDSVGSARYMGSPDPELVNADFQTLTDNQRRDYTIRKQILWESETATEAELSAKEVEMIRKYRSNEPTIGYNYSGGRRWPDTLSSMSKSVIPFGIRTSWKK
jgi:hypothetical protein